MIRHIGIGFILIILTACAEAPVKKEPVMFWPAPPDPPKIAYVRSLAEPKDIGAKPSWFKRALRFLFGESPAPHLIRPAGIAVDDEGGIYVADPGLQVVHYFNERLGVYRQVFKLGGSGARLQNPVGVALDRSKRLYVSDVDLNRVFVFGPDGALLRAVGKENEAARISGIAVDPSRERLYVVDTMGHQVLFYDLSGEKKGVVGRRGTGEGEFNFPTYAAVDPEGRLYVADSLNFRIQFFDPEGRFEGEIGNLGDRLGEFSRPKGVAVDQARHVYVVDTLYDTVQIFNRSGELLLHFGRSGMNPGSFWLPSGIAVDPTGRIYVADSYNERVQVFQLLD